MNYKSIIPLALVGVLLVWFVLQPSADTVQVEVNDTVVQAEVADTQEERIQGLSGRAELPENHGMLFVFEREGRWGIWMKDMHFSLDIIWADSAGRIVHLAKNVAPDTYPQVFYPTVSARYVLEAPAGFVDIHGIAEGMQVVLH